MLWALVHREAKKGDSKLAVKQFEEWQESSRSGPSRAEDWVCQISLSADLVI